MVGLAVGELAARGRRHRDAAWQGRHQMALLHSVTELAATGQDPQVVVAAAAAELQELLSLKRGPVHHPQPGRDHRPADAHRRCPVGNEIWSTGDLGLPTHNVDLPVRSGGWLLGHFLLTPTPGRPISHDRLLVAVAIADQVGAALAADEATDRPAVGTDGTGPMGGPGNASS